MDAAKIREDKRRFDDVIASLEAQIANTGTHLTVDVHARSIYAQEIRRMSDGLKAQVQAGRISWLQAAVEAQTARNAIMEVIRSRSTPVGRAIAESLKKDGYTLNQLVAMKTTKAYGEKAVFAHLSGSQQNTVYANIVTSAGSSNLKVNRVMARLSHAGRGLLFVAIALSIYNISTAKNKAAAIRKELSVNGAGIAGGIAGGMLAGLACGPAAPACVTAGAFIGGALAAFSTSYLW